MSSKQLASVWDAIEGTPGRKYEAPFGTNDGVETVHYSCRPKPVGGR